MTTAIAAPEDQSDNQTGGGAASALLLISADYVDDIEKIRIATENRLRSLKQVKGLGDTPESRRWESQLEALNELEAFAISELKRAMRAHPLGEFVKGTVGLGEKQTARL